MLQEIAITGKPYSPRSFFKSISFDIASSYLFIENFWAGSFWMNILSEILCLAILLTDYVLHKVRLFLALLI